MRKVRDINLTGSNSVDDILKQMTRAGGFTARDLGEAADILDAMVREPSCIKFLSFPAAPVATGLRGVLRKMVEERLVDVIVTTCGTLDHDLARVWGAYHEGAFEMDDADLYQKGIHRLGNVLVPRDSYGVLLEEKLQPFFDSLYREGVKEVSSADLCARLGHFAGSKSSILYWASRHNIPVFVPGLTDGAVGNQLWLFSQQHRDFKIDLLGDEQRLSDIVFEAGKTGALIIGGGISKHHTLWWNQFRGGLDYAVNITSAVEWDGSLSGAAVREAVSWGKVRVKARKVTIRGEATALLPFIVATLLERLKNR
jgi:deoxyhypusine synthase